MSFDLAHGLNTNTHAHTGSRQNLNQREMTPAQSRRLLSRGNDLLAQSSTETLLDMLKSHAGIKECSDETVLHINGVCISSDTFLLFSMLFT